MTIYTHRAVFFTTSGFSPIAEKNSIPQDLRQLAEDERPNGLRVKAGT